LARKLFVIAAIILCTTAAFGQEADVSVLKTGPEEAAADSDVSYTVTVTSLGPDAATNVTLTDNIPAGMTFVSASPTGCTTPAIGDPGTVTCTIASLPAGDSAVYTFVFHIGPQTPPGTFFTNIATVACAIDPNDENNSSTATTSTPPPPQSDAGITKSGPSGAGPDTDVVYTISVSNSGPDAAASFSWTDTLPGTLTFVSLTQDSGPTMGCTTGPTVTCSLNGFPANTAATFTLTAHVPAGTPAGTTFHNTATVTATNDPNAENDIGDTTLTVASADVSIVKVNAGPGTAAAGTPFSYTITAANAGPDAAETAWSDVLPANTTFVSLVQDNGPVANCQTPLPGTNGNVVCSFLLGNGASAQFTLTIAAGNTPSVTNTATIGTESFDPDSADHSSSATTTITPSADLAVTKSGPAAVTAGTNITYTVSVTNNGPTDAANVAVGDTLPANTTFVSATQNSGPPGSCGFAAGAVTCTMAAFPLGATATFTFVFNVSPALPNGSTVTNTATVSSSASDPNGGNNSSMTSATVAPTADLAVTKTGPATVTGGSNVTYTVTLTNNGASNAANATLTDTLPANTTFVSANQTSGPVFNCVNNATTITCTNASFAPGSTATFEFVIHVTGDARGSITNTASAASTTADPTPQNSSASTTAAVNRPGDAPTLSPLALALLSVALGIAGLFAARRG